MVVLDVGPIVQQAVAHREFPQALRIAIKA